MMNPTFRSRWLLAAVLALGNAVSTAQEPKAYTPYVVPDDTR
jgi:hypothetical protein